MLPPASSATKSQAPEPEGVPFWFMVEALEKAGTTKGENSKNIQINHLATMFKHLLRHSVEELVRGYWLAIVKCGPEYEKHELFIGKEILTKAVARACGMSDKEVREQHVKCGDLGQVAQNSKSSQKTMDNFFTVRKNKQPLTIRKVHEAFLKISRTKGNNSNTDKENTLMTLLLEAKREQSKYIVRWVEGNLKIAAAQKTMQRALLTALFEELFPSRKQTDENLHEYQLTIKKAIAEYPNEEKLIRQLVRAKDDFTKVLESCRLTLGVPCKPMLAKPTKGIGDILTRFQGKKFTCEYKYDGLRGQIHYDRGDIHIFSRNLEDLTGAYADVVKQIIQSMSVSEGLSSFILDCQIVAVNKATKQLLPFQVLSTRSRKIMNASDADVHVNLFAFDILYYNEPITHLTLRERREYLAKLQPIFSQLLRISEHSECDDFERIDEFLKDAIKYGTEGLMIKDLESAYTCSKRSWEWVKLKKDYIDGLGDTLDVVPIGAFYGAGKRKGLYGSYLLAVYNSDMEVYETICKIGTGFSDQVLQKAFDFFQDKITPHMPKEYRVGSAAQAADVWFQPAAVWEIKGADMQLSPVYTCGIGDADPNRGIGLRFPRLINVRDDKKPTEATTSDFVIDIYKQQAVVKNTQHDDDDDFY